MKLILALIGLSTNEEYLYSESIIRFQMSGSTGGQGHVLFEHWYFHGKHKHIFQAEPDLNNPDDVASGTQFAKITSSIVILEGEWIFFRDPNYMNGVGTLGRGQYPILTPTPISNDTISSLKLSCDPPIS